MTVCSAEKFLNDERLKRRLANAPDVVAFTTLITNEHFGLVIRPMAPAIEQTMRLNCLL